MINNLKGLNGLDQNAKALYQQGKALMHLSEYSRARDALLKAKQLSGNDFNIIKTMEELDQKVAVYREEEKRLAQNALSMILHSKKTNSSDDKASNQNQDINVSEKSIASIEDFLQSDMSSLQLPNNLSNEEISALRAMEKKMGFKVVITETMSESKQIRLVKEKH